MDTIEVLRDWYREHALSEEIAGAVTAAPDYVIALTSPWYGLMSQLPPLSLSYEAYFRLFMPYDPEKVARGTALHPVYVAQAVLFHLQGDGLARCLGATEGDVQTTLRKTRRRYYLYRGMAHRASGAALPRDKPRVIISLSESVATHVGQGAILSETPEEYGRNWELRWSRDGTSIQLPIRCKRWHAPMPPERV